MKLSEPERNKFRRKIYSFYHKQGRHSLPWRQTRDPYEIMVSEFMLQQTQVPRVLTKFAQFIRRFPDFNSLSRASLKDVLREWSGLGYNRRALMLKRTAEIVVNEYGGKLPRGCEILRTLPGIGTATAAEISAFAFNEAHPFIETNIRSVFIHEFFPNRRRVSDEEILPLVAQTMDRKSPREWFYALMDYGVELKRENPNPSRKSAHHAKQSRFEGSDRQARGTILRALTKREMNARELRGIAGLDAKRLRRILAQLCSEGLLENRKGIYCIA